MTTNQQTNNTSIIICDTNIVVLMALFKPSLMFSAKYTFGVIKVHQTVIDEFETWISKNNRKVQKFTLPVVQDMANRSKAVSSGITQISQSEREKSYRLLHLKEGKLDQNLIGSATSDTDKELLTVAWKNKANLATQEKTMRALATETLGKDRVLSFEDLVLDLIATNQISKADIDNGLDTLNRMNESLGTIRETTIKDGFSKHVNKK